MAKKIKGEWDRSVEVEFRAVDPDKRTAEITFSSEMPVERDFGTEVLDHSAENVDFSRGGLPLFLNHDPEQQIGFCDKPSVRNGKCTGVFKFSRSAKGQDILNDVVDGIRTSASVGYRLKKAIAKTEVDGMASYRFAWQPLEASLVGIPEDPSVGPRRRNHNENYTIEIDDNMLKRTLNLDAGAGGGGGGTTTATTTTVQVDPNDILKKERLRNSEIEEITARCLKHNPELEPKLREAAKAAKDNGEAINEFRKRAFELTFDAKPISAINPEVGMDAKEIKRYSLLRAIRQLSNKQPLDGIEAEASRATAKLTGKDPAGFFIPHDVLAARHSWSGDAGEMLKRALQANVFTGAGAFVGTDILTGSFIELLRNRLVVGAMGAGSMSGLVGNVAIPSQTGGATVYWLPESGTVTVSAQTVGQLTLTPHQMSCATAYTKQLLNQSSVDVENFVRNDLMRIIAIEKDRVALNGLGSAGEPLGIINTSGLSTTTTLASSGTTITYANALTTEGSIATSNADLGALGFVTTILCRQNTRGVARFSNTDTPVWDYANTILGYPAKATNNMPSTTSMIFGNWSDLILADWAGVDILVDPYSLSLQAQIRIVVNLWTDIGIRHAKSFVISTT